MKTNIVTKAETINSLYEKFAKSLINQPNKTALIYEDVRLSYKDLSDKIDILSERLYFEGVVEKTIVAVELERDWKYAVSILAISKLGAVFVPIDTSLPDKRKKYIVEDSRASFVIDRSLYNEFESVKEAANNNACRHSAILPSDDSLAYIIYTSGSTGVPKGVQITNNGFKYLESLFESELELTSEDTILQFASIAFDASIWEISMALMSGGTLAILTEEQRDPESFLEFMNNNKVTIATLPPNYLKNISINRLKTMETLITAGSEPSRQLVESVISNNIKYINAYGPTETTVCACLWSYENEWLQSNDHIPIGKFSCGNLSIVDTQLNEVDLGGKGELLVSGIGLSKGYIGNSILTKKRFIYKDGKRFYRTGDFVSVDKNENIFFEGRKDNQIKFNGYRIELEEVERAISKYLGLTENCVLIEKNSLVCYFTEEKIFESKNLKDSLLKFLPGYMVPDLFIQLKEFPINTSGKVDKSKLSIKNSDIYTKNEEEISAKLYNLLEELLPLEVSDNTTNLIENGLNSLGLIKLSSQISNVFKVKVSIKELSDHLTISGITKLIREKEKEKKEYKDISTELVHDEENRYEPFPLTDIQTSYLLGRNNYSEQGGFGTHGYFEILTNYDPEKLNIALNEVIQRNDMLRAIFGDDLTQCVLPNPLNYQIDITDMTKSSLVDIEEKTEIYRNSMSHHVFDYSSWPLFDIKAIKVNDQTAVLFISIDGLIADAGSMKLFAKQWTEVCDGKSCESNKTQITFRDYVMHEENEKNSLSHRAARDFWIKKIPTLSSAPKLSFENHSTSEKQTKEFQRNAFRFSYEKWNKIKDICKVKGITPTIFFTQIYIETLNKWSEEKNFTINFSIFNRKNSHPDVNKIIGDFTTTTFLDNQSQEYNYGFFDKASSLQNELFDVLDHISFNGIEVIREYKKLNKKDLFLPYVITSLLTETDEFQATEYLGKLQYGISQTPQVYLDMQISNDINGVLVNWDYSTKIFSSNNIDRMKEVFLNMVEEILLGNDNLTTILPQKDKEVWLSYNDTNESYSYARMESFFEKTVTSFPNKVAIKDFENEITYEQLYSKAIERSQEFSDYLSGKTHVAIGVVDKRNIQTIIDVLAVLYSGNYYVPLDKNYPIERIEYIKKKSEISFISENIDTSMNKGNSGQNSDLVNIDENDLAYVIFTSGSTGEPKGVEISHKAAINTILDVNNRMNITSSDNFLMLSSLCFDLSVYDLFGAIFSGASVTIAPDQRDIEQIIDILQKNEITIWNSVPSTMNALTKYLSQKNDIKVKRPEDIFRESTELNHCIDEKVTFIREENEKYKQTVLNRYPVSESLGEIKLSKSNYQPSFLVNRRSSRLFGKTKIKWESFENLITSLGMIENSNGNQFMYPSAGGLYPIDIYLSVKEGKIENLDKGVYYYSPVANELVKTSNTPVRNDIHLYTNKQIEDESAYSIYLVYNLKANVSKYGSDGYVYSLLDSGIIAEHIALVGEMNNIHSCSIGKVDNDKLVEDLGLSNSQIPIHTIILGGAEKELDYSIQTKEIKYQNERIPSIGNLKLRVVMLSGDSIPLNLPDKIRRCFPLTKIYSLGGATEGSIWSICYPIATESSDWTTIPYGYPLSNQKMLIMKNGDLCPIGVIGEIVIAGNGVAEGYINDTQKTNNQFVSNSVYGRVYKTGDYGVLTNNGYIDFKGRKDSQVKVNGYRVDLLEIEKEISKIHLIKDVVVLNSKNKDQRSSIQAYVVTDADQKDVFSYVIEKLRNKLPVYMLPNEIIKLDKVPYTNNGKVDKKGLFNIVQSKAIHTLQDKPELNSVIVINDESNTNHNNDKTRNKIRSIFKDVLGLSQIDDNQTIFNLGGDSITIVGIQKKIENEYHHGLKIVDIFENSTVNKLTDLIDSKSKCANRFSGLQLPNSFIINNGTSTFESLNSTSFKVELSNHSECQLRYYEACAYISSIFAKLSLKPEHDFLIQKHNSKVWNLLSINNEVCDLDQKGTIAYFKEHVRESRKLEKEDINYHDGIKLMYSFDKESIINEKPDIGIIYSCGDGADTVEIVFLSQKLKESKMILLAKSIQDILSRLF